MLDQPFVKEPKLTVRKYVEKTAPGIALVEFDRFKLGEGIEVAKQSNFADEVAAQVESSK